MSRLWVEVQGHGSRLPHLRALDLGHVRPVEGDGHKGVLPGKMRISRVLGNWDKINLICSTLSMPSRVVHDGEREREREITD